VVGLTQTDPCHCQMTWTCYGTLFASTIVGSLVRTSKRVPPRRPTLTPRSKRTKAQGKKRSVKNSSMAMAGAGFAPVSSGSYEHVLAIPPRLSTGRTVREHLVLNTTWDMGDSTGALTFPVNRNSVSSASAWSTFAALYDSFRVNGMRIRIFFPQEGAMVPGVTKVGANTLVKYPACVVATYDNDAVPTSTLAGAIRYDATQYLTPTGECIVSLPRLPKASVYNTIGSISSTEWIDVSTPTGLLGAVNLIQDKQASTGASTSGTLLAVTIVVEFDVTFRERV